MTKSIAEWQKEINQWGIEKGWNFTFEETPEKLMLMVTELSEAMEEYRKGSGPDEVYSYNSGKKFGFVGFEEEKPEGIGVELADTVIRILHYCGKFNIDLDAMIELKMAYNQNRPYRHGNKIA